MKLLEAIQQDMISHLLQLCKDELELNELPNISFIDKSYIGNDEKRTFGEFNGNLIKVVTKNRHPIDIARTLAHELTHWKQHSVDMDLDGSDGSDIENQANAIAGIIMRRFSERYPDYFINSLPKN